METLGPRGTATLGSSWRRWDLGVLLHCYAGVLVETLGPRGTATLLRWGPRGDAGTLGYCYTVMLGSSWRR